MVLADLLCAVFPRAARKNRTPIEIKERSAEGRKADCVSPVDERNHMTIQTETPIILLYNPKVALPGYQRLPHSLLQLGGMLEGRYAYEIIDGNLEQERDRAAEIIEQVRRDGVRYLGVTIMPGPQLQQAVPDIKRIKAACPGLIVIVGGYFPTNHVNTCSKDPTIDYVVLSAGEDTLLELLDTLESGGDAAA